MRGLVRGNKNSGSALQEEGGPWTLSQVFGTMSGVQDLPCDLVTVPQASLGGGGTTKLKTDRSFTYPNLPSSLCAAGRYCFIPSLHLQKPRGHCALTNVPQDQRTITIQGLQGAPGGGDLSAWLFRPSFCQGEPYTREMKDWEGKSEPVRLDYSTPGPQLGFLAKYPNCWGKRRGRIHWAL